MDIAVFILFFFSVAWTVFAGIWLYLCLRLVCWLETQSLSRIGGVGSASPAHPSYSSSEKGVLGSTVKERSNPNISAEELAKINERIDTDEAHKSARRKEKVTMVGEDSLCKEEVIEN